MADVKEIVEESTEKSSKKKLENKNEDDPDLEKLAELESIEIEVKGNEKRSIEEKKKKLLERAKKLSEKVEETSTEELKEQVKAKKKADMLVPLEEYIKSGIYLGRRTVTPEMKPFVYRRRADGLAIFNTDIIDEKIKEAIEFLANFDPEDVILVCKRQTGWETAKMFSRITGIRTFTKKYPAGILTNPNLSEFTENELTIVTDSWLDKNAVNDTLNAHKKIMMICDTNNFARGVSKIIIGNNKTAKSLGLIFYLLAKGYCNKRGIKVDVPDIDWWTKDEGE